MPPRLILNADDFGLTPGINRAIVALHRAKALSSATLMATGSAFEDAVECARNQPELGVGCHLVFVDGVPVSQPHLIPTLIGPGSTRFRTSLFDFIQAALSGTIDAADLTREALAQIQKIQQSGIAVTHLDTHKHTHCIPSVARVIFDVAERCGVTAVRNPFEPDWSVTVSRAPRMRKLQLRAMGQFQPAFQKAIAHAPTPIRATAGTLGMAATGTLTAEVLRATLQQFRTNAVEDTYELCCHPGHPDALLDQQTTRLVDTRGVEYAALLHCVPEFFGTPGAPSLIHYGDVDSRETKPDSRPQQSSRHNKVL